MSWYCQVPGYLFALWWSSTGYTLRISTSHGKLSPSKIPLTIYISYVTGHEYGCEADRYIYIYNKLKIDFTCLHHNCCIGWYICEVINNRLWCHQQNVNRESGTQNWYVRIIFYWSNLPCDWLSTVWAYWEYETENSHLRMADPAAA